MARRRLWRVPSRGSCHQTPCIHGPNRIPSSKEAAPFRVDSTTCESNRGAQPRTRRLSRPPFRKLSLLLTPICASSEQLWWPCHLRRVPRHLPLIPASKKRLILRGPALVVRTVQQGTCYDVNSHWQAEICHI